jgi:small subunit ribosomal protein S1
MYENLYLPEGSLIGTKENSEYLSCVQGVERAMAQGRILEAVAVLCDGSMNLTVDLGCMYGYVGKNECAFNNDGDSVKDIAIISRVGKPICFKVLRVTTDENGQPIAILSRRLAQIECMNNYIMGLMGGDIIPARVTHLEHFGAFVDIGCGIASLLSIDCISVSRISHPKDRFFVGMPIRAVVKSVDHITGRVCVSHKELLGTWEENASKFCIGQTVMGVVRSVEEYGIFIELAPNLAGLAEYRPGIAVGQIAAVYIKNIIPERMKIKLVIIDACKNETPGKKLDYYVEPMAEHIDYWRYSPHGTCKVIESRFV